VLEEVMRLRQDHPGANHFYIHAVEASRDPERAVPSADRLVNLIPGAGHLVHMPAHIYTRVGRYADAVQANERAIAADQTYFAMAPKPDFYSLYYVHNVHFLAYAAMMEGRYERAISAARQLEVDIPEEFLRGYVELADGLMGTPLHVMIRFGKWQEILDEPPYPEIRKLSNAQRHYARAVALAALGRTVEARAEQAAFEEWAATVPESWKVGNNTSGEVIDLCRAMMSAEILFREGEREAAFEVLAQGAALEDALVYDEPPGWMQPVRHAWGALLMSSQEYARAEAVYREDLAHNHENGWSLLGLEQSLRMQGQEREAEAAAKRRHLAWARADVEPTSSCYCEPGS
jgi:tetratricopeptide (TPR) repeat protein